MRIVLLSLLALAEAAVVDRRQESEDVVASDDYFYGLSPPVYPSRTFFFIGTTAYVAR